MCWVNFIKSTCSPEGMVMEPKGDQGIKKVVATRRWVSPRRRKMGKIITRWTLKEDTWEVKIRDQETPIRTYCSTLNIYLMKGY
jgi:hypothetical protein